MSLTGIDIPISLIRDDFSYGLWTTVSNRIFYSRAFRNEKLINASNQLIPEVFTENNEYKEVLFDDKWNISVFFDVSESRSNQIDNPSALISAIFAVNLDEIYPGETFRQEENVHGDVIQLLENSRSSYRIIDNEVNIVSGLNAYGDFFRDNVNQYNMQPWHTFRVDMTVEYVYACVDNEFTRGSANPYPDPVIIN